MSGSAWFAAALGVLGGAAVTLVIWKVASSKLDQEFNAAADSLLNRGETQMRAEITRTLDAEIPPRIRAEMDRKFREVGLNANSGRQLAALLTLAETTHLIGVRR